MDKEYTFTQNDAGCYGDSSRGIYLDEFVVDFAQTYGFDSGDEDTTIENEFLNELADEAMEFLNSITDTTRVAWGYSENGDFGLWENDAE